jgi:hypothetical protein
LYAAIIVALSYNAQASCFITELLLIRYEDPGTPTPLAFPAFPHFAPGLLPPVAVAVHAVAVLAFLDGI